MLFTFNTLGSNTITTDKLENVENIINLTIIGDDTEFDISLYNFSSLFDLKLLRVLVKNIENIRAPKLLSLLIDGANLEVFSVSGLDKLEKLNLSNNKLSNIDISNLLALKELRANYNNLTELPKNIENLEVLTISNNKIHIIENIYLPNLKVFHLSCNDIKKFKNVSLPTLVEFSRYDSNIDINELKAPKIEAFY